MRKLAVCAWLMAFATYAGACNNALAAEPAGSTAPPVSTNDLRVPVLAPFAEAVVSPRVGLVGPTALPGVPDQPGTPPTGTNGPILNSGFAAAVRALMQKNGVSLLLYSNSVVMSATNADFAPEVFPRAGTTAGRDVSRPSSDSNAALADPPTTKFLVVDRETAMRQAGTMDFDTVIAPAIRSLMLERGADLVLDRNAVIMGRTNIDVTPAAVQRAKNAGLAGGPRPADAIAPQRIVVVNRRTILAQSLAGKSLINQTQALSQSAEAALRDSAKQMEFVSGTNAATRKAVNEMLQAEAKALQSKVQSMFNTGARQLEIALDPILTQLLMEHSADVVLNGDAVALASFGADISKEVIERLDNVLTSVSLQPQTAPAKR